jgi:hypothetical protein
MSDVSGDLNRNYEALKNELLQSGFVSSVTKSSSPVTSIWSNQRIDNWEGMQCWEQQCRWCGYCYRKTLLHWLSSAVSLHLR